uniref:Uncharacterized protein n=1 Tax=Peronospora matthiolae TaxID=2874970 RepID=A0AAV1TCC4_9STRA
MSVLWSRALQTRFMPMTEDTQRDMLAEGRAGRSEWKLLKQYSEGLRILVHLIRRKFGPQLAAIFRNRNMALQAVGRGFVLLEEASSSFQALCGQSCQFKEKLSSVQTITRSATHDCWII